ncbi:DUF4349 domain-containing protein [Paenibacillus sp. PR3]|uniref:DUF4349 domain-containing protein n=1 Tax=Paenibacillus terricola TaxID=2763503 RepID=A0ABR8MZL2_9BACL|nr:DUF4349 domain-containing protein [Paenibacillus terricola]MBD3920385.1 DUF4349 domain-containing protein [Paenibacillus terricola]
MKQERRTMFRIIGVWLAVLLLAAGLVACGSSDSGRSELKAADATTSTESASAASSEAADGHSDADTNAAANTAAEAPSQSGSGIADTAAQADFNRQVIYTADLQMQVKDFAGARSAIDKLIASSGGYLLSFTENESTNRMSGSFKIKVPAKGFNSFISAIDKLPDKKLSKSINGEDVTEEYADLSARLKAKEVAEARLISFMESAKTSKDLVAFSNELAQVQEDIERIKGRMRYIDQNVAYSTINIDMYQNLNGDNSTELDLNEKPGLMKKAGDALQQSSDMIVAFGKALVIIAAFLLPILPIAAIIILIVIIVNRRRKRTAPVPAAQIAPPVNDPATPVDIDSDVEGDGNNDDQK